MDDVKAMSRAGDTVGKAVGTGWLAVRRGAKRAGQASAEATIRAAQAADQKLTERGVAPQQLGAALAESAGLARQEVSKSTRRTRKRLARTARHTRKELAKAAAQARRDAKRSKPVRKAAKAAKRTRADAAKLGARARREAAALRAGQAHEKKRRRWPKVLLLVVVASGVAYVVRGRSRPEEPEPVPEPRGGVETNGQDSPESPNGNVAHNGRPTQESRTK